MSPPSPSPRDAPDEAFVSAFLEVCSDSCGKAISSAHSILKDRHLAEDAVSEATVKCLYKWEQCRERTKESMTTFFLVTLKTVCLQKIRRHRKIIPFDDHVARWEVENATRSPADLLGDCEAEAEELRVLQLLVSFLPANYQAALWERSREKLPSGHTHSNVVYFRAKKAVMALVQLRQKAFLILGECPHRLGLNRLTVANRKVLQTWLVETGSTMPKADGPWRLYASEPKWVAFRASIQSFKPAQRIPILMDFIPVFRELNS